MENSRDERFNRRWEDGVPHDPRTLQLFEAIVDLDFRLNSDYFCWKRGGDGDNGEIFMFVLDEVLQRRDESSQTLADQLNEVGAQIRLEPGSNREILVVPDAIVNLDTVTLAGQKVRWSNKEKKWMPSKQLAT